MSVVETANFLEFCREKSRQQIKYQSNEEKSACQTKFAHSKCDAKITAESVSGFEKKSEEKLANKSMFYRIKSFNHTYPLISIWNSISFRIICTLFWF